MNFFRSIFGSKEKECNHLLKYQGTSIDIAGISIPNIFSLGSVSIKPQVLQAAEKAIQYLDMNYFQNCETLKQAPNEESKTKYYEQMTKQQQKLNDIAMAIAAYSTNTNSQRLEETLSKILESDLPLPESDKDKIKDNNLKEDLDNYLKVDISQKGIKAIGSVEGPEAEVNMRNGELDASQSKIETDGSVKGGKFKIG